jgi:hypothetical protein
MMLCMWCTYVPRHSFTKESDANLSPAQIRGRAQASASNKIRELEIDLVLGDALYCVSHAFEDFKMFRNLSLCFYVRISDLF